MTEEQKKLMTDNGIDIDSAVARFGDNEELYLKYFRSFPEEETYKKFRESFKVDKLWQSQNILVTFIAIVGNLSFTRIYEDSCDLLKSVKIGNASNALSAIEKLDKDYTDMLDFIRNLDI